MQLKLAPYNPPWQWKVIQGEVAKRHIATLFFHYVSDNEFTATVIDRAYVSVLTEKITLDRKAKSVRIEERRNLTRGEKAARILGELWHNGELSRLMSGWPIRFTLPAEFAGELIGR